MTQITVKVLTLAGQPAIYPRVLFTLKGVPAGVVPINVNTAEPALTEGEFRPLNQVPDGIIRGQLLGNDLITIAGMDGTYYTITTICDRTGTISFQADYRITGASWDISTATPLNTPYTPGPLTPGPNVEAVSVAVVPPKTDYPAIEATLISPSVITGATGPQGIQGIKGDKGDKGDQGDPAALPSGTPNQVVATNASGSATNRSTLRALVVADIPSLPESLIVNLVGDLASKAATTYVDSQVASATALISAEATTRATADSTETSARISADNLKAATTYVDTQDAATLASAIAYASAHDFSGSYIDLTNKPTIPTNTNQLTNGAGFITASALSPYTPTSSLAVVALSGVYSDLTGKPALAAVALSGAYADLTGRPTLATVAISGSYTDLTNKPTIPAAQVNSDWNAVSGITQIVNKPTLVAVATSGLYSDLSGTPVLATVATSGAYSDLTGKPALAAVATSGVYSDLTGKPQLAVTLASASHQFLTSYSSITGLFTQSQPTYPDINGVATVTNSSISTAALYIARTDNSPAVSGAGIINAYLAPMARMDLITQSGNVTGAQNALLLNMPSVKGKDYTTFTSPITGGLGSQTVAVADSSVFTAAEQAVAGLNLGGAITETVTITAIPDSTHITANFLNNHAANSTIGVTSKGDKIGLAIVLSDQAGNKDSIFAENLNVIANSTNTRIVGVSEMDITNATGAPPGKFFGDTSPYIFGLSIAAAGGNPSTVGVAIGLAVGTATGAGFSSGFFVDAAIDSGLTISWGAAGKVTTGISIAGATTNGIVIGSNQTALGNPVFAPVDPTIGILLTSRGITGSVKSNLLRFQELDSSVSNTWDIYAESNELKFAYNGTWQGAGVVQDGSFYSQVAFRVVDATNTQKGAFLLSGTSSILQADIHQVNGTVAAAGTIRLQSGSVIALRNNANSADVNGLSKDTSDIVQIGGTAGAKAAVVYIGNTIASATQITGTVTATRTFTLPDANSNSIQPSSGAAHQFATAVAATGVISWAQPAFTDISGAAVTAQIPNLPASQITSGQLLLVRGGTGADLSATGGTSQVLKQTSVGGVITVGQLSVTDISGAAPIASPVFTGVPTTPAITFSGGSGSPSGIPASIGGNMWLGTGYGSPSAARFIIGDGSSWRVEFAKRTASTETVQAYISDQGNINVVGNYFVGGVQIAAANLSNGVIGTGNIVLASAPTLVTPNIGAATASLPSFSDDNSNVPTTHWARNITGSVNFGSGSTRGLLTIAGPSLALSGSLILGSTSTYGTISGGTSYSSANQYCMMSGVGIPRLGDWSNGWIMDWQDELFFAVEQGATVTFSTAPNSGNSTNMFHDDTNTALWNSGIALPFLQVTVDLTTNPNRSSIPSKGNGFWNPALTFRQNTPTYIQCESWVATTQNYTVTNVAITTNVLTLTTSANATNWFAGQQITFSGVGTATFLNNATITNIALTTNVLTVTCTNNFKVGQTIKLTGLTTATFLEAQILTILSVSGSQFTASFTHADYVSAVDTGVAAPFIIITSVSNTTVVCSITVANYVSAADTGTGTNGNGSNSWMTIYNSSSPVLYSGQLWIMPGAALAANDAFALRKLRFTLGFTSPLVVNTSIQRMMVYHATSTVDPWHLHVGGSAVSSSMMGTLNLAPISPAIATISTNFNSNSITLTGNYWTGSVGANDVWTFQNILGAGTNPTSTLTLTHTGSSGVVKVSLGTISLAAGSITASKTINSAKTAVAPVAGVLTLDASTGNAFRVNLNANVTSMSITNPTDGQEINIMWVQDATGSRSVAFAANLKGATTPSPGINTVSAQAFMYDSTNSNWYALGAGSITM